MHSPSRRATYDDLLAVPEHQVAEILDGGLIVSPRPASPHAVAGSVIGADLIGANHGPADPTTGRGGWQILFEPEVHCGDDVLVPDLAGWRRERLPVIRDVPFFTLAPDWVCEVVSPSTARVDRTRKTPLYAREGVRHLWMVDPLARTLEVYRLDDGEHWTLVDTHAGDATVRPEPFVAMHLALARWWLEA